MIEQLQLILKALPWTGPAVLGGFVLALVTALLFPTRRSRADRLGFALLTWCLVVAAVVTLSPVKNDYFGVPTTGCDWSVWKPLARDYWFSSGSRPPNVWLFFPAGVGVMLLDGVWRKIVGIAFLVALSPGIETLQDLYPELKRSCSSQDVADNWTGLALGLAIGAVLAIALAIARAIARRLRLRRERRDAVLCETSLSDVDTTGRDVRPDIDDRPLPLGGRNDGRHYDDFGDFDDRPNSSRWHGRQAAATSVGQDTAAGRGTSSTAAPLDDDATRAMPRGASHEGRGADATPPYGVLVDATPPYGVVDGEAPTQAIPERGATPASERDTSQQRRPGSGDTVIIRRS